ncbi:MAG: glycosyltransferase [Nitrospiraceae bacterium]|nr:MAG: glycosyltransferase [Nitrospiraceae bacterium]
MDVNLDKWTKDWGLMSRFFRANEIALISEKLRGLKVENVVFCSFENRFAKSGGLAAVTTNILPYLKEVNNIPNVILMTPFYPDIMDKSRLRPAGASFNVPYRNRKINAGLYEYVWNYSRPRGGSLKEYYLNADGFFKARNRMRDPYLYHEDNSSLNDDAMRESSLFFCRAVPEAMNMLGLRENIVFHLQEWQTALVALTSKEAMLNGTLKSCGAAQTMHNSYDSFIPFDLLTGITGNSLRQKISLLHDEGLTAYQIGLQLTDAPVTTVSEHFAGEFTTDVLQTGYFAPHLQNIFRSSGVYGVNNGMFTGIAPEYAGAGDVSVDEARKIKLKKRKALLKILSTYRPEERFGDLTYKGKTISNLPDNVPIVVMSGRYDPLQKGYDVLLRAVEKFDEDEIKVIMTPLTVRPSDLDYFYEVACKCRGNLTVLPLRLEKGYHELQTGATFGVMPSIYEPFGAAVEYMASGTVNIGRATGGLIDQIDPECGFLFREDAVFSTPENIRAFAETGDVVQARKTNPWIQSMADNLYDTLKKAVHLYQYKPESYYRMIISGFKKISKFTWESGAETYFRVYKKASSI